MTDSIAFQVGDLARLFRQSFERAIAAEGLDLTPGEARTLHHIARCGSARQAALAERMHVEPMTLCGFLDRLEVRGLVERHPDAGDRRAKRVTLARAAEPLVERIGAIAASLHDRAAAGLPAAEIEQVGWAIRRMRDNLSVPDGAAA